MRINLTFCWMIFLVKVAARFICRHSNKKENDHVKKETQGLNEWIQWSHESFTRVGFKENEKKEERNHTRYIYTLCGRTQNPGQVWRTETNSITKGVDYFHFSWMILDTEEQNPIVQANLNNELDNFGFTPSMDKLTSWSS